MAAFIIWSLVGAGIAGIGISAFFSKKPVGFWANAETMKVNDIKGYNCATGKLFIAYGAVFILLGLPLLADKAGLLIMLSVIGVMFETIAAMAVYAVYITKKYRA